MIDSSVAPPTSVQVQSMGANASAGSVAAAVDYTCAKRVYSHQSRAQREQTRAQSQPGQEAARRVLFCARAGARSKPFRRACQAPHGFGCLTAAKANNTADWQCCGRLLAPRPLRGASFCATQPARVGQTDRLPVSHSKAPKSAAHSQSAALSWRVGRKLWRSLCARPHKSLAAGAPSRVRREVRLIDRRPLLGPHSTRASQYIYLRSPPAPPPPPPALIVANQSERRAH